MHTLQLIQPLIDVLGSGGKGHPIERWAIIQLFYIPEFQSKQMRNETFSVAFVGVEDERSIVGSKSCWGPGNERAVQKAKERAESTKPEVPLTLRRAKSIISTYIYKYTAMTQKTKSFGKPWETLATVGSIPRHLKRADAVARFPDNDFFGSIPSLAWHGC
ncbi:uncharacterized protein TNCV_47921 [Trichonephila clavipes]|nr:uncharacterized protein TNCV_47921 [Trichonephila clavipes]